MSRVAEWCSRFFPQKKSLFWALLAFLIGSICAIVFAQNMAQQLILIVVFFLFAGWLGVFAIPSPSTEEAGLFQKLAGELPGMVYQLRLYPDGRSAVTYTNPAIRFIYELEPEEVLENAGIILDLLHPEDRERIWASLLDSYQSLKPWIGEYRVILPRQGVCWRMAHARVERLLDGSTLWHGCVLDINAKKSIEAELQKAKESAEAASRAKGEFLAIVSHEIRTPMNGILGFSDLLENSELTPEQQHHVEAIKMCSENLLAVIHDVLDLSKIESGQLAIQTTAFDLKQQLGRIMGLLKPKARSKGLYCQLEISEEVPKFIETDSVRLSQILINILGNAIKFTQKGGVTLFVSSTPESSSVHRWTFKVQDSGIGIPGEALDRIFEPFRQVDGSARRPFAGVGLGLAISRKLCELLNGSLSVHSEIGKGSVFTIEITAPVAMTVARNVEQANSLPSCPSRVLRVLVVEDNELNRKLLGYMLKSLRCESVFAETGVEAIQLCQSQHFDLVFMDMQLPKMDGCEATSRIREKEADGDLAYQGIRLPIVALTANAMSGDEQKCLAAGMDRYLAKPVRKHDLLAVLLWAEQLSVRNAEVFSQPDLHRVADLAN